MKQTISVLVENRAGVLNRVASLFSRRAFNIDSLAVGVTDDPSLSRMTIIVDNWSRWKNSSTSSSRSSRSGPWTRGT